MIELQAATKSSLGEGMRAELIASIDHALGDTADDPVLTAAMTELGTTGRETLMDARTRLMAWSLETPHGVGSSNATEIADSVARIASPEIPDRHASPDILERLEETLTAAGEILPLVDKPDDHVHVWDLPDGNGRRNWRCACSAVKCDLPRCIRPGPHAPPHHIDRS